MMRNTTLSRHGLEEIDTYLKALPDNIRSALSRVTIMTPGTGPDQANRVSYQIHYFGDKMAWSVCPPERAGAGVMARGHH